MITIHTVKQKNTGEDKNKHGEKNNISLISFFTIFNNIKGRKKQKRQEILDLYKNLGKRAT